MMRAFAGTTLFVMVAWFGGGDAATQNGAVRNRVGCDSLVGFAVPATVDRPAVRQGPRSPLPISSPPRRRPSRSIGRCSRFPSIAA